MALAKTLSVDICGEWSPRQADAVLRILEPELSDMGICVERLDVTCFGKGERVLLQPLCAKHAVPLFVDSACEACVSESK